MNNQRRRCADGSRRQFLAVTSSLSVGALLGASQPTVAAPDAAGGSESGADDFDIIGYYAGWTVQSDYEDDYGPEDVQFESLDSLVYAFASIDANGSPTIEPVDESNLDGFQSRMSEPTARDTEFILSVGGWGEENFSAAAASAESRRRFASELLDIVDRYDFDGVDLDWEYPATADGGGHSLEDEENYAPLFAAVRDEMNDRGGNYVLTGVNGPKEDHRGEHIDWATVFDVVDRYGIMTYDFTGGWAAETGLNSPLYDIDGMSDGWSVDGAMTMWSAHPDVDESKLLGGIPFFPYSFNGVEPGPNNDGLSQPFAAAGETAGGDLNDISVSHWPLLREQVIDDAAYTKHWHDQGQVPYLYAEEPNGEYGTTNGGEFVTYENRESVAAKTEYFLDNQYAGVLVWDLFSDTSGEYLTAIAETAGKQPDDTNETSDESEDDTRDEMFTKSEDVASVEERER